MALIVTVGLDSPTAPSLNSTGNGGSQKERMGSFDLGWLLATPGVLQAAQDVDDDRRVYLSRHARGDRGVVNAEDRRPNDRALVEGTRLLPAYPLWDGTTPIWIVTGAGRSAATILLPDEY